MNGLCRKNAAPPKVASFSFPRVADPATDGGGLQTRRNVGACVGACVGAYVGACVEAYVGAYVAGNVGAFV